MKTTPTVEICDHCHKAVDELWVDDDSWHFCPVCWSLYHDYKPKNECNYLTFEKKEKKVSEKDEPVKLTQEERITELENIVGQLIPFVESLSHQGRVLMKLAAKEEAAHIREEDRVKVMERDGVTWEQAGEIITKERHEGPTDPIHVPV